MNQIETQSSSNESQQSVREAKLNFIDLQKFLLKDMQMQANYQPIMIKTLLLSGGRASKDSIVLQIRKSKVDVLKLLSLL